MEPDNSSQHQNPVQNDTSFNEPKHHKYAKLILILAFVALLAVIFLLSLVLINEDTDPDLVDNSQEELVSQEVVNEEQTPAQESSLSESWLQVDTKNFTINVPDGWEFTLQDNEVLISDCSDAECYKLEEGTPAVVKEVTGGRDGLQGVLVTLQAPGASIEEMTNGYTQLDKLDSNFTLYKKVTDTESSDDEISASLPVGTVEYVLVRGEKDGSISYVYYSVLPTQSDPTELIKEMILTYKLKNQDLL